MLASAAARFWYFPDKSGIATAHKRMRRRQPEPVWAPSNMGS